MGNTVVGPDVVFRSRVEPGVPNPGSAGALYWIIFLISAATVISGIAQIFFPEFVLRLVGGATDPTARHFFSIIGMFMALFGGLLLNSLRAAHLQPVAIFWSGLQKFGASIAVAIGVQRGLFTALALGIAAFDFLSGVLILWYWNRVRT